MKKRLLLTLTVALLVIAVHIGFAQVDESWTFSDDGVDNYILTDSGSVSSSELYSGSFPASDPTINLVVGQRYQVTVTNASTHPFQLLAKGPVFSDDIILASQGTAVGSMESDPGLNWTDDGLSTNGAVEFTLTSDLVTAMNDASGGITRAPGYRCGVHISTMRGDFNISTPVNDWSLY